MGRHKFLIAILQGALSYPLLILLLSLAAGPALSIVSRSESVTFGKFAAAFAIYGLAFAAFTLGSGALHAYLVRKDEKSPFFENIFVSFMYALSFEMAFTAGVVLSPQKDAGAAGLSWLIGSALALVFSMLLFLAGKYAFGLAHRIKKGN